MATHDFGRLSSFDFEELVRDVLQAEWGLKLETFTAGKDQGIDLRHLGQKGRKLIVQCKHSPNGNFGNLFRLLSQEVEKVRRLKPSRYLIATSVGLTPYNKQQIVQLFDPYIRSENDVLGRDDINNLLRSHPEVETANFKLWLTSSAVLDRVLHNAEKCQTEFEVDRACRRLPIFIQCDAFPRAKEILDKTRIVIVSGAPGIGKTTLADILRIQRASQEFLESSECFCT